MNDANNAFPFQNEFAVGAAPVAAAVPTLTAEAAVPAVAKPASPALADDVFDQIEPVAGPKAEARVVAYARGKYIAFAPNATQELIEHPQYQVVPGAAYYAHGLIWWQQRHIPFIHLESVLRAYPAYDPQVKPQFALVLAYQTAPRTPLQFGAIAVTDIPYSERVGDADFCPLPKDSDMWAELAISCFRHKDQAVPVLDAVRIFGAFHG